ncbi:MAG: metallophosphoesterase family protein [Candidatus Choladocola sp.]|nr:metallophosphoesterase family protein [Candidatus Choladocola sp.]
MSSQARISAAVSQALVLPLRSDSRYVLFGDCHRGIGNGGDNFLKNEFLYLASMDYYNRKCFTYLELGDGDELWENRSIRRIIEMHDHTFELLSRFYRSGRMYALYGNHDMVKKNVSFQKKQFLTFYCDRTLCEQPLYPGITFYPAIVLADEEQKKDICLIHGHQAELFNSTLWRLSAFLVRYIWRPLEFLGVPDPTSAARNNTRKKETEKTLTRWAVTHNCLLVTGHTHHPSIGTKAIPYCNVGSCVSPGGITCIEIENRCLTLVKWSVRSRSDQTLYAGREILGNPVCVDAY